MVTELIAGGVVRHHIARMRRSTTIAIAIVAVSAVCAVMAYPMPEEMPMPDYAPKIVAAVTLNPDFIDDALAALEAVGGIDGVVDKGAVQAVRAQLGKMEWKSPRRFASVAARSVEVERYTEAVFLELLTKLDAIDELGDVQRAAIVNYVVDAASVYVSTVSDQLAAIAAATTTPATAESIAAARQAIEEAASSDNNN